MTQKTADFIVGLTTWLGAGVSLVGAFAFNWNAEVIAGVSATTAAVVTIEKIWLPVAKIESK